MICLDYIHDTATGLPVTMEQAQARVAEILAALNCPAIDHETARPLLRELHRWGCGSSASEIAWRRWRVPSTDKHFAALARAGVAA